MMMQTMIFGMILMNMMINVMSSVCVCKVEEKTEQKGVGNRALAPKP